MNTSTGHGVWRALFGGDLSFEEESALAATIQADWQLRPEWPGAEPRWTVVCDSIPGWLMPLWAADEHFLYLRRPEGVWKIGLPTSLRDETVCFEQPLKGDAKRRGRAVLGQAIRGQGGWFAGMDGLDSPAGVDARQSAEGVEGAEGVDLVGIPLYDTAPTSGPDRLVLEAADDIGSPPTFARRGDWLLAIDKAANRRVAYPLHDLPSARQALAAGQLWLRFSGPFLAPFEARVVCSESWK